MVAPLIAVARGVQVGARSIQIGARVGTRAAVRGARHGKQVARGLKNGLRKGVRGGKGRDRLRKRLQNEARNRLQSDSGDKQEDRRRGQRSRGVVGAAGSALSQARQQAGSALNGGDGADGALDKAMAGGGAGAAGSAAGVAGGAARRGARVARKWLNPLRWHPLTKRGRKRIRRLVWSLPALLLIVILLAAVSNQDDEAEDAAALFGGLMSMCSEQGATEGMLAGQAESVPAAPSVLGENTLTIDEMEEWWDAHNPGDELLSDSNIDIDHVALMDLYLDLGEERGVRGDVAFAQAIYETNWLEEIADGDHYNYGGLRDPDASSDADDDDPDEDDDDQDQDQWLAFDDHEAGVEAHLDRLAEIASGAGDGETLDGFNRIGGEWSDTLTGQQYWQAFASTWEEMLEYTDEEVGVGEEPPDDGDDDGEDEPGDDGEASDDLTPASAQTDDSLAELCASLCMGPDSGPPGPGLVGGTPSVMGSATLRARQIQEWWEDQDRDEPLSQIDIEDLIELYISEGRTTGVRADVAFAQAIHETGWFTNSDSRQRNNFAGIGNYNDSDTGNDYETPREGVRAHVDLLASYADGSGPGQAETWGEVGEDWSGVDTGAEYWDLVNNHYSSMLEHAGVASPGDSAVTSTGGKAGADSGGWIPRDMDLDAALAALRYIESTGDYEKRPNGAGASGAYQFVPRTWKQFHGSDTPSEAYLASPGQQDAAAIEMIRYMLRRNPGAYWAELIPGGWLGGHENPPLPGSPRWSSNRDYLGSTPKSHHENFVDAYKRYLDGDLPLEGGSSGGGAGMAGSCGAAAAGDAACTASGGGSDVGVGGGGPVEPKGRTEVPEALLGQDLTPRMECALRAVVERFGTGRGVGCMRPGDPQHHGVGRACDFMVSSGNQLPTDEYKAHGDRMAEWLVANADSLGVRYIIWEQRIWNRSAVGDCARRWCGMVDRGNVTQNHFDHVHLSVEGQPCLSEERNCPPTDLPELTTVTGAGGWALPAPSANFADAPVDTSHHDYPAWDWGTSAGAYIGMPVYAIRGGRVSTVNDDSCGRGVNITDGEGNRWTYCHAQDVTVSNGGTVQAGDQIMTVGYSGHVIPEGRDGAHLHLGIRTPDGSERCPQQLLASLRRSGVGVDVADLPTSGCTH